MSVTKRTRANDAMAAASSSFPAFTARSSDDSMRERPAVTAASLMSQTVTSTPALADTSAIPAPMSPAPDHTDAFDGLAHASPRSAPSLSKVAAV